ncbi:hypothetical protein GQ54DRAFT_21794 [Martensiomyces pterosporus]|nr:hypothetical protein GQ54DRAFT_21794 [Martensiomyces pterosporus]
MKIAVFGGLGALAHEFVVHAAISDHHVSWYLHTGDRLPDDGLSSNDNDNSHAEFMRIVGGSGHDDIQKYQEAVRGCDAVFVAFDPKYSHDTDAWAQQQLKIQTAMKREGVQRILAVTMHGAGDSQRCLDWSTWMHFNLNQITSAFAGHNTGMNWSLAAHYSAQERVIESGKTIRREDEDQEENSSGDEWQLKWTIIRPGLLVDGEATGTYLASHDHVFGGSISCADVVDCSLKALEEDMDVGESFSIAYSARVA